MTKWSVITFNHNADGDQCHSERCRYLGNCSSVANPKTLFERTTCDRNVLLRVSLRVVTDEVIALRKVSLIRRLSLRESPNRLELAGRHLRVMKRR